jgi:hypothetical protein
MQKPRAARLTFLATSAVLLTILVGQSREFGATWDEPQQRAKAQRLIAHLEGRLPVLNEPLDGAHLYGAPFDVVAELLQPLFPLDPYVVRHGVIAVVGWLGLVLCGLLADRLFGPPHGVCAMLLLAASPLYIAHASNNPKDLPFATIATAVILGLTWVRPGSPILSWRAVVFFAALIGLGLNVRPGALLFVGYVGVVVLYRLLQASQRDLATVLRAGSRVAIVLIGAVSIGWVAWPWAYGHPLAAPFRATAELGHFGWAGTVLFDGASYPGTSLPWGYIPTWFWLTTPPVVLAGLALSLLVLRSSTRDETLALWAAVIFPVLYAAATHATLYDGIRHLLFVVPIATILAVAGWLAAWRTSGPARRMVTAIVVALGIAEPLLFQWRNHPNQAAYIQPLAGGPSGAYARYDLDYWGNCLRAALARVESRSRGAQVFVTGSPMLVLQADVTRFPNLVLVAPEDRRASYFVRLARGSQADLLALSSDPHVRDRITTADGALLCAVSPIDATQPAPISRR